MMQKIPAKKVKQSESQKNARRAVLALALLLFCCGAAWAWQSYSKYRTYRKIADQAIGLVGKPGSEYDIDMLREQLPNGYFQRFSDLIDVQRDRVEDQRMLDFFGMSKEEQYAQLDKDIAEEDRRNKRREEWRKQRDAERAAASASKQSSGSGNSGAGSSNSQNSSAGNSGNSGGGGGSRSRLLSARLDNSTPQHRAMRAAYRTMMNERRAAVGLPPTRSPRLRI